jgi:hypothetical protein
MARVDEGGAMHGGDPFFVQQCYDKIFVIGDFNALGRGFADAAMDGGEHVERAFGLVASDAFSLVQHIHHQIAASFVHHDHFGNRVFRPVEGGHSGGLGDGGGVGGGLALQFVHCLDKLYRRTAETDAPAGHGIGFGAAVHGDGTAAQGRLDLDDGGGFKAVIGELVVDVVGEHPHIGVAQQHIADGAQLLGRIGGTGRVAGGVEEEPFGLRRDGGFQIFGAQLEAVVLGARHKHGRAFGQSHDVRVRNPARGRDDNLVTRLHRCQHGVENHLLAACGNDDFLGLVVDAGVTQEFGGDGFAQRRRARDIGIFGIAGVDRVDGRLFDMRRGVEIRLAGGEADDIAPRRFQRPRFGGNGDGLARADTVEAVGDQAHLASRCSYGRRGSKPVKRAAQIMRALLVRFA